MFQSPQKKAPVQANHKLFWYNLQNYFSSYFGNCWIMSKTAPESTHLCYPNPCASRLWYKLLPGARQVISPLLPPSSDVCWGAMGNHKPQDQSTLQGTGEISCQNLLSPPVEVAWAGTGWRWASSPFNNKSTLQMDCTKAWINIILI